MADDLFFVHLADPGFPDPPWPGERRLGPFLSHEEATDQAINDVAHGHITPEALIGVFSETESLVRKDKMRSRWEDDQAGQVADQFEGMPRFDPTVHKAGKAHVPPSRIIARAVTARKKLLANQAAGIEDQRQVLAQLLPEGVSVDDLMASVRTPEDLARLLAEKP